LYRSQGLQRTKPAILALSSLFAAHRNAKSVELKVLKRLAEQRRFLTPEIASRVLKKPTFRA